MTTITNITANMSSDRTTLAVVSQRKNLLEEASKRNESDCWVIAGDVIQLLLSL
jgi:hypothetical protein